MVRAGQPAALFHLPQHAADHRAQGVLDDLVIGNQAVGRTFAHALQVNAGAGRVKRCLSGHRRYSGAIMRTATISRKTAETAIDVTVNLDGTGTYQISTGIGFLDHMIEQLSRHSLIDIALKMRWRPPYRPAPHDRGFGARARPGGSEGAGRPARHHPFRRGLFADGRDAEPGRARYFGAAVPRVEIGFTQEKLGELDTELIDHWFHSFAGEVGLTLHVETLYGRNNHHICESIFKGLARALRQAVEIDPRKADAIPSTKGTLGGTE